MKTKVIIRAIFYKTRYFAYIIWKKTFVCLHYLYLKLRIESIINLILFLLHHYGVSQLDLKNIRPNYNTLLQGLKGGWFDASSSGRLEILTSRRKKAWFFIKNILSLGACQKRVERVIFFTFVTLTLELYNPFDKHTLLLFLRKKISLLKEILSKVSTINGRKWDQFDINLHIDVFNKNSLLQCKVIDDIHHAVRRSRKPAIILEANEAMRRGISPLLVPVGLSGSYWIRGLQRQKLGLFKPFDEEAFAPNNPIGASMQGPLGQRKMRPTCRVGESAHAEVGAFLVDSFFGFGLVPKTYYAKFTHNSFFSARENPLSSLRTLKTKYGSFQEFVDTFVPLKDLSEEEVEAIPTIEFQLLVILDVIIGNSDRHAANILVGNGDIAAIDHGLCFPDKNLFLSFWYWKFKFGELCLPPSLVELLTNFPFERLCCKLQKNCFMSQKVLDSLRERVVLFTEGTRAGLVPAKLADLMDPKYLLPLQGYKYTLQSKAREQVDLYLPTQTDAAQK